jgi:uncharacterized surface protein with fasciclin (FAS1) repeats
MYTHIPRRKALITASIGTATILLAKASSAQTSAVEPSALQILQQHPEFSDWLRTLQFAGLSQYADTKPDFTAFVTTNAAFHKYPDVLAEVLRNNNTMGRDFPDTTLQVSFIRSHIIRDLHRLSESNGKISVLTSLTGTPITIDGTVPGSYIVTWVSLDQRVATTTLADNPIVANNALIYPVLSLNLS